MCVLACLVLVCTLTAMFLPADALTEEVYCGMEEHTHGESCYQRDLICPQAAAAAHEHTDACKTLGTTPVCGEVEAAEHTAHTYTCGTLTCTVEHTHEESCYDTSLLTCGLHVHTDDCYETGYICEESKVTDVDTHVHTDSCYGSVSTLICTETEHTHSLICYSDTTCDLETAADWEAGIPALTGVSADDLVAVAKSQLGYKESAFNYAVADDGVTMNGYTRYGEWFGAPYADWNSIFVSFCLNYAKIENVPYDIDYDLWIEKLEEASLYSKSSSHTPAAGEIVFLDMDGNSDVGMVGIISTVQANDDMDIIVGNYENMVTTVTVNRPNSKIVCYGCLAPIERYEQLSEGAFGENNCLRWKVVEEAEDYRVLYISGNGALDGSEPWGNQKYSIKRIVIEDGVTSIPDKAFENYTYVEEVEIAGSVKTIGYEAFYFCSNLKKVILHEGVEEIGEKAFDCCQSLSEISLPDGLTTIGRYAFYECNCLETITIPGTVTTWGDYAFNYCWKLETVTIQDGITTIPKGMFSSCSRRDPNR